MKASISKSLADSIEHYGQLWNVQYSQILQQSASSWILLVKKNGQPFVLKIFTDKGRASEGNSSALLRAWAGDGAVQLVAADLQAQLLEYVPGGTLAGAQMAATDEIAVMSDVITRLRAHKFPGLRLPTLREHFLSFELAVRRNNSPTWTLGSKIFSELLAEGSEPCVLHGDFHQQNILRGERGWLAIDPKGVLGDPAYEVANSFFNPLPRSLSLAEPERIVWRAKKFSERLKFPEKRILRFAYVHGLLSAAWSEEDGEDPREVLQIVEALRGLL